MTVRVRFAPSPTGHLHIGSVRTALFNFLYARRHGGQFILRIEDTDVNRNVEGAELEFLDGFRWLQMLWDEGIEIGGPHQPYRCMERLNMYRSAAEDLLNRGLAYPCFCSDEELAANRDQAEREGRVPRYSGKCYHLSQEQRQEKMDSGEAYSIRFHVNPSEDIVIEDEVRDRVTFQSDDIGDFVIVKSNRIPTYNFQVVIDDHDMDITHVIRAEEHLSNTPRQILVYRAFGWETPKFAHLPIVLDQNRKKLSKRDPSVLPIASYRDRGYIPQAIVNFLSLLGWSPEGEEELFSLDELCASFNLDRVGKAGAVFDVDKLNWMANQYFKSLALETATEMVSEQLVKANQPLPVGADNEWLATLVSLYQEQMVCAADFLDLAKGFFAPSIPYDDDALEMFEDAKARDVVTAYLELCIDDEDWTPEGSRARFKQIQKDKGIKGRALFMPVRAAVTGQVHGPDLQKTIATLPKEWVVNRLATLLSRTCR